MRRLIVAFAVMLIGFSGICFGRELVNPDTLKFKKTYSMPGMTKNELYEYVGAWKGEDIRLDDRYGDWRHKEKDYHIKFDGQVLESTTADIDGDVFLRFRDGEFDLIFTNIGAAWRNNFVVRMSTHDDRFNRTWLWRVLRSKKILNQIRARSKELFEIVTVSMDHYLEVGPPVELKKVQ